MQAKTIDEVIQILQQIIMNAKRDESTLGYFAALYLRVTIEVKNKLGTGYFDNDARMEQLDVVFANRYLNAYFDFKSKKEITNSWKTTFEKSSNDELVVLQHLLLGMNAHINLDLGIVAAEICTTSTIDGLQNDFNRINEILASLVNEVQENMTNVWPMLKWILKKLNGSEDFIVDFSMKIARDGAWKFANKFVATGVTQKPQAIVARDNDILKVADMVTHQNWFIGLLLKIVRWTEVGTVTKRIESLEFVGV